MPSVNDVITERHKSYKLTNILCMRVRAKGLISKLRTLSMHHFCSIHAYSLYHCAWPYELKGQKGISTLSVHLHIIFESGMSI